MLPHFAAPVCHTSTLIDLKKIALANRRSVKIIFTVLGSDSTHMVVTSPVIFKQPGRFFWEKPGPGFCGP